MNPILKINQKRLLIYALFSLIYSISAKSDLFSNSYIGFELPSQWSCNSEGAEWICQSMNQERKKDAVIVLTAHKKSEVDSLEHYFAFLKNSKHWVNTLGKSIQSDVKYTKITQIQGHPWVDSLHANSEVEGFFTRYLATVRQDVGILVTYSVDKNRYLQYLKDFEVLIDTLRFGTSHQEISLIKNKGIVSEKGPRVIEIPAQISNESIFENSTTVVSSRVSSLNQLKSRASLVFWVLFGLLVLIFINKRRTS